MVKCFGKTLDGTKCSRDVNGRRKYCWQHTKKQKGGRKQSYQRQLGGNYSQKLKEGKASDLYLPLDRVMAEYLLLDMPVGTYVIRDSSQNGQLSITHIEKNGTVGHGLIRVWNGENNRIGFSIEDSRKTFETLEELIEELQKGSKLIHINDSMERFKPIRERCDQYSSLCAKYDFWEQKVKEKQQSQSNPPSGTNYGSLY